jgi:rare lipoprotein A
MTGRTRGQHGPDGCLGRIAFSRAALAPLVGLGLLWPATFATSTSVEAKTPGKTYCFYRVCHRVMTLEETRRTIGKRTVHITSHYDDPSRDRFNPSKLTSSGEWFRSGVPDNAASPKLPNGTVILAWNPATRQAAVLRINNAGPYWGKRTLDVSRAAAERLGFARQGVATLHTQVIYAPTRADVTYKKGRRYAAVPGHIGAHGSFETALAEAGRRMGTPLPTDPVPGVPSTVVAAAAAEPQSEPTPPAPTAPALLAGAIIASAPELPAVGLAGPIASTALLSRQSERWLRRPFEQAAVAGLRRMTSTTRVVPVETRSAPAVGPAQPFRRLARKVAPAPGPRIAALVSRPGAAAPRGARPAARTRTARLN